MGFTVLRLANNDEKAQWVVLLDKEHVMFTGTYRQCEEWLDVHEFVETASESHSDACRLNGTSFIGRITGLLHAIADRCQFLLVWQSAPEMASLNRPSSSSSVSLRNRAKQALVSLLTDDAGSGGSEEIVIGAILIAVLYMGLMLVSVTIACGGAAFYSTLTEMRWVARPLMAETARNGSGYQGDSLDIACDIATPILHSTSE